MCFGANYYILKPTNSNLILKRIRELRVKEAVNFSKSILGENSTEYININSEIENVEVIVTKLLHKIGVPAHIRGYQYIRYAIIMTIDDQENIGQITKRIYPEVAKKFKSTSTRVERAIRHAIEVAVVKNKNKTLDTIFENVIGGEKIKPTNSEFIFILSEKIKMETEHNNY